MQRPRRAPRSACSACTPGGVQTCSTSTRAAREQRVERVERGRARPSARRTRARARGRGRRRRRARRRGCAASARRRARSRWRRCRRSRRAAGAWAQAWVSFVGIGRVAAQAPAHAERVDGGRRGDAGAASPGSRPASRAASRSPVSRAAASAPASQRERHSGARGATSATARSWSRASRVGSTRPSCVRRARGSPRTARSRRARAASSRSASGRSATGQRRRRAVALGVGEHVVGKGHHGVAGLGQPGVLHDDAHLEVAVVDDAVDHAGVEPDERPGGERMLREARRVDGLQPPAPRDDEVGLGGHGVQVGVPPARPSGAGPPYTSRALTEVAPGNTGDARRSSRTQQLGHRRRPRRRRARPRDRDRPRRRRSPRRSAARACRRARPRAPR